jgi:hypothetical protein
VIETIARKRSLYSRALLLASALLVLLVVPAAADGPPPPPDFFGIYADAEFDAGGETRDAALEGHRRTGVGSIRQPFDWHNIEVRPGELDLTYYDNLVGAAAVRGIEVMPMLIGAPQWASTAPPTNLRHGYYPPSDLPAYGRFAAALARRYGPDGSLWREHPELPRHPIRTWQIWNEANLGVWWLTGPDAREYTALLAVAAQALRDVDPGAEIVTAGIPDSALGVPLDRWIRDLYAAGAAPWFDTLAIHPYAETTTESMALVERARALMDARGDSSGIRVTEFGWATGGVGDFTTTEAGQGQKITRMVDTFVAERTALRLRGIDYFMWRDGEPGPGRETWIPNTGLLRSDGSPKPGWFAYADAIAHARPDSVPAQEGTRAGPGVDAASDGGAAAGESAAADGGRGATAPGGWQISESETIGLRAARRQRLSRGRVRIMLRCLGATDCIGTLELRVAPRRPARSRLVRAGRRRFALAPGDRGVYYVQVSRRTRSLLRRRHLLRARVTAVMPAAGPASRAAASFWIENRALR